MPVGGWGCMVIHVSQIVHYNLMATNYTNKKIKINNNNNNNIKRALIRSCAKEPETPYNAQRRRYYLHKNMILILILCPIYN